MSELCPEPIEEVSIRFYIIFPVYRINGSRDRRVLTGFTDLGLLDVLRTPFTMPDTITPDFKRLGYTTL